MTKTQLVNKLKERFFRVGVIQQAEKNPEGLEIRKTEGVNWYLVGVYEEKNGVLIRRNIPIYVVDEGTEDEQAFYGEKFPESTIPDQPNLELRSKIEEKISAKEADGTIVKGEIETFSEKARYAIVKSFVKNDAGEIVEKKLFVYLDKAGKARVLPMAD